MPLSSPNFIKNYFLDKLIDTRLFFLRETTNVTNFIGAIKSAKKILIILPKNRAEEVASREYIKKIYQIFDTSKISKLDIQTLRKIDINWLGVPNKNYISKIRDERFDLLIDINSYHERLCSYLGALIESPMRIHLSPGKFDKIYNLQFRTGKKTPVADRFKNLINYLSIMRNTESVS